MFRAGRAKQTISPAPSQLLCPSRWNCPFVSVSLGSQFSWILLLRKEAAILGFRHSFHALLPREKEKVRQIFHIHKVQQALKLMDRRGDLGHGLASRRTDVTPFGGAFANGEAVTS